jgi:hypothetical protein
LDATLPSLRALGLAERPTTDTERLQVVDPKEERPGRSVTGRVAEGSPGAREIGSGRKCKEAAKGGMFLGSTGYV